MTWIQRRPVSSELHGEAGFMAAMKKTVLSGAEHGLCDCSGGIRAQGRLGLRKAANDEFAGETMVGCID
ncbi:hypothetical protein M0R45_002655 [Rubus argutus]|uniref:Uncharacterized protein n=1 Tax=Rubus argutus TaxID=59490 RepID=A0AAW1VRR3_RUBAR